jgi:hypothetical protein
MSTAIVNKTGGVVIEGQTYYGLDAETALKQAAKFDFSLERKLWQWIEASLDEKLKGDDLGAVLKDGTVLCRLINRIKPNSIKKINQRDIALMKMENIKLYLEACFGLGLPSTSLFTTSDLYNRRGLTEVLRNLEALARYATQLPNWTGPRWDGPKIAKRGESDVSWPTVEMKPSIFIQDTESAASVDLRAELVKLQQQLARVSFERDELLQQTKTTIVTASTTPTITPSPAPQSNAPTSTSTTSATTRSTSADKAQLSSKVQSQEELISSLTNDIKQLQHQLQTSTTGNQHCLSCVSNTCISRTALRASEQRLVDAQKEIARLRSLLAASTASMTTTTTTVTTPRVGSAITKATQVFGLGGESQCVQRATVIACLVAEVGAQLKIVAQLKQCLVTCAGVSHSSHCAVEYYRLICCGMWQCVHQDRQPKPRCCQKITIVITITLQRTSKHAHADERTVLAPIREDDVRVWCVM